MEGLIRIRTITEQIRICWFYFRHVDIGVWMAVRDLPVPVEPGLDVQGADHGGLQVKEVAKGKGNYSVSFFLYSLLALFLLNLGWM